MTDERLVSVSWYASEAESEAEQAKLREAGIEPSVHAEYRKPDEPVEVLVPESRLDAARAVLGIPPEGEDPPSEAEVLEAFSPNDSATPSRCPECGSTDTGKLPSYAGRAVLVSIVIIALSAALGQAWIGAVVLGLLWFVFVLLARHAGKWRCRQCGWEFAPENARMRP